MSEQNRYPGYIESPINFKPSYKRSKTDQTSYFNKKNQAPSYTDRILVKNNASTGGQDDAIGD